MGDQIIVGIIDTGIYECLHENLFHTLLSTMCRSILSFLFLLIPMWLCFGFFMTKLFLWLQEFGQNLKYLTTMGLDRCRVTGKEAVNQERCSTPPTAIKSL